MASKKQLHRKSRILGIKSNATIQREKFVRPFLRNITHLVPTIVEYKRHLSIKEINETTRKGLHLAHIKDIPKNMRKISPVNPKTGKLNIEPKYANEYNSNTIVLMLAGHVTRLSDNKTKRIDRILMRSYIKAGRHCTDGLNCKARRLKRLNYKYARKGAHKFELV
jgi:hypothetical protein